jgi:hypothetical protein
LNVGAAVISAVAAFASVIAAIVLGRRAEFFSVAERQRADAHAASERRHASFNTVSEWSRDLREWAGEAVDVLSEATYLCETEESSEHHAQIFSCRHRLSSLIDRGRFFLPNIRRDEWGLHKPYAYRGFRHSGLDPLVAAEHVLSTGTTGRFSDRKHALVEMKREFVSSIQQILDPERHNQEVARMIHEGLRAESNDPTLGGLLPDHGKIPLGTQGILRHEPSPDSEGTSRVGTRR